MDPLSLDGLRAPPPREHGAVSQLSWVPVADLVVDRAYQRDMTKESRRHVERIAAEFDWSLFSPVIVAPVAGGRYAIIDGQHRAAAALLVGEKSVPAMVVVADRARQAKSFAAVNGKVFKMTAQAVFRAALAAGDPSATLAHAIASECGVRVLGYPVAKPQRKPGDTLAAASIQKTLADHGEAPLRLALTAIMASQGDKRSLVHSLNVRALAMLFRNHPMPREIVTKAFAHIDLSACAEEARRDGFQGMYADMRDAVMKRLTALARKAA